MNPILAKYLADRYVQAAIALILVILAIHLAKKWLFAKQDDRSWWDRMFGNSTEIDDWQDPEQSSIDGLSLVSGDGELNEPLPGSYNQISIAGLRSIALRMHDEFTSYCMFGNCPGRCQVIQDAQELNNNQLRWIANAYRQNFRKTLRSELAGLWEDGCSILSRDREAKALIARLDAISITS